jgi:hypothetical protein
MEIAPRFAIWVPAFAGMSVFFGPYVSAVKIRVTTAMSKKRVTAVSSMMGLGV